MVQGKRAAVRPRVRLDGGAQALLEDEIRALIEAGEGGTVAIVGGPGSGKTTALEHLAATLPAGSNCTFLDELEVTSESLQGEGGGVVIVVACSSSRPGHLIAKYELAAWTRDDVIEYLLAAHKDQCVSVIGRFHTDELAFLEGNAQLCRMICDELAGDALIDNAKAALRRSIQQSMRDDKLARRAGTACLSAAAQGNSRSLRDAALPAALYRILRHRPAQLILAAETLVATLRDQTKPLYLDHRLPRGLALSAAEEIRSYASALDRLRVLARHRRYQPMAASILHLAGAMPLTPGRKANLRGAYLSGVVWSNAKLIRADLREADLCGADLRNADLTKASLDNASLAEASLTSALLGRACLNHADLSNADLAAVKAEGAFFDGANLSAAKLAGALLRSATFNGADLSWANFQNTDLSYADLTDTNVTRANFAKANLDGAKLASLRLQDAELSGASFVGADLTDCELENVELPGARFSRAILLCAMLSGSVMRGADFTYADLGETGLADIDWEGASLRNADLRGATFHMGGSRSGLVGSPIASEGSRTGFYTDEFEEQYFKSPEEIRKANLCGADLRGAIIEGVDFYLVDLRGAKYDPDQESQLRRSGAILEARV
jgi:uncharacterized protein YjbI with pentapeptide repeats